MTKLGKGTNDTLDETKLSYRMTTYITYLVLCISYILRTKYKTTGHTNVYKVRILCMFTKELTRQGV